MTTAPDMLKQFGGAPVGSDRFAGWWGNDVWFVDFDNGQRTHQKGKNDIDDPQKDLAFTFTDCGPGDVIYIRPRTGDMPIHRGGYGDYVITPPAATEENWEILQAKNNLTIVGTGNGLGRAHGVVLEGYAGETDATVNVRAPYVTFENIGFNAVSGQVWGLLRYDQDHTGAATESGFSGTVINCHFVGYPTHATAGDGALSFETANYSYAYKCNFYSCVVGASIGSSAHQNQFVSIVKCNFYGITTEIDCDITIHDCKGILIDNCYFMHGQPANTTGTASEYIHCFGTTTGMLCNSYFGTTEGTMDGVAATLGGLEDVGNKCGDSLAAPSVFMTST